MAKKKIRYKTVRVINPSRSADEVFDEDEHEHVPGKACCNSCAKNRPCETTCNPKKTGKRGALYLYEIEYARRQNPEPESLRTSHWAYDEAHALEQFYENDDDWRARKIARVSDKPRQRWHWTKLNPKKNVGKAPRSRAERIESEAGVSVASLAEAKRLARQRADYQRVTQFIYEEMDYDLYHVGPNRLYSSYYKYRDEVRPRTRAKTRRNTVVTNHERHLLNIARRLARGEHR
jgi:hypothetical protein